MMRRGKPRIRFEVAILLLGGCADLPAGGARPDATRSAIELAESGAIFALATTLGAARAPLARLEEAASRSSGGLLIPLLDASRQPLLAANGTRLRGSCGVTFISPSYAVTAAHCVDDTTLDVGALTVEMFRASPNLTQSVPGAALLSGVFPDFSHPRLDAGGGYFLDRYPCALVSRCSSAYGGPVRCDDAADLEGDDIALVRCDGSPGLKYGFVDVAATDDPGAELFMPWKHEVYDVPDDPTRDAGDDRWQHYVLLSDDRGANYHYFGADEAGIEQNQLLPLVSPDFPDGTAHHELPSSGSAVTTDLFGCHGTSGSGVLQQPANGGAWRLLGPVVVGDDENTDYLCDHVPAFDGSPRTPGSEGLAYMALPSAQHLWALNRDDILADCAPLPAGATSLFTHLDCWTANLAGRADTAAFAAALASPAVRSPFDPLGERVATLKTGGGVELSGFATEANRSYRIGLTAWSSAGCSGGPCPRVTVSVDGQQVLAHSFAAAAPPPAPLPLAAGFVAPATKTVTLSVAVEDGDRFEVGAFTLRLEGAIDSFDSEPERLEAALFDLDADAPVAQAMRFVGDGKQGFAAQLAPHERMVFARAALPPGQRWTARLDVTPASPLLCGLVDETGAVAVQADCTSGSVVIDDTSSPTAFRGGFFVETPGAGAPVTIDDLQLVSDSVGAGPGGSGGRAPLGPGGGGAAGSPPLGGGSGSGGAPASSGDDSGCACRTGGVTAPLSPSLAPVFVAVFVVVLVRPRRPRPRRRWSRVA